VTFLRLHFFRRRKHRSIGDENAVAVAVYGSISVPILVHLLEGRRGVAWIGIAESEDLRRRRGGGVVDGDIVGGESREVAVAGEGVSGGGGGEVVVVDGEGVEGGSHDSSSGFLSQEIGTFFFSVLRNALNGIDREKAVRHSFVISLTF